MNIITNTIRNDKLSDDNMLSMDDNIETVETITNTQKLVEKIYELNSERKELCLKLKELQALTDYSQNLNPDTVISCEKIAEPLLARRTEIVNLFLNITKQVQDF